MSLFLFVGLSVAQYSEDIALSDCNSYNYAVCIVSPPPYNIIGFLVLIAVFSALTSWPRLFDSFFFFSLLF